VRRLAGHAGDARLAGALDRILAQDPFWAVRLAALEVLGAIPGDARGEQLRAAAADPSSGVRQAALRLLGGREDPADVAFLRARFEMDDSYLAQGEALRAIGRCGDRTQLPFLERARELSSPNDVVRRAADEAIAGIEGR
jgi:aminopeptidase N